MNNIINAMLQPDGSVKFCVLVTIIDRRGSAPRSSGSRMVVFPDRSIQGTIGGGKLESEVIDLAIEFMLPGPGDDQFFLRDFHFSGTDAASMDMICGGAVCILFEKIYPNDLAIQEILKQIIICEKNSEAAWFTVEIDFLMKHNEWALLNRKNIWGNIHESVDEIRSVQTTWIRQTKEKISIVDRLDKGGNVLIFGAGHVAQPIAQLCTMVDFSVTVIDDRSSYANSLRFPTAQNILAPNQIQDAFSGIQPESNTSIVIVTRGHLQDHLILEWALTTQAGYIGMIGSRRKWGIMKEDLQQKGFHEEDFNRVHTPIGVDIGAETPDEIGISVVAELIQFRAERYGQ
jgi:xanthine dehydrogenase accessory factor